jgi:hypothetical protein
MVSGERKPGRSRRAAVFFGAVLCVLLTFFAIERRVAAYPAHNVAAATIAATGVQKPDQIAFAEPNLRAPVLFLCLLVLLAASYTQSAWYVVASENQSGFSNRAPTPLAVRPPPAL